VEDQVSDDNYPSAEELLKVREWPYTDTAGALAFVASIWTYSNQTWREGDMAHFATGGWSGNEDLIHAMQENAMLWALTWQSSERGGKHVFRVLPPMEDVK
jgi:hypothetical protein